MKRILSIMCLGLLAACQPLIQDKEHSEFYTMPLGSEFVLHQVLTVPPNHGRVFIQYGHVLTEKQVDEYYPYCEIEVRDVKPRAQLIQPNRFKVVSIVDDEYEAQRASTGGLLPVSDGWLIMGFASEYHVKPERPSAVRKITCLHWDDVSEERYLSIAEIRQVLGKVMSLVLQPERI